MYICFACLKFYSKWRVLCASWLNSCNFSTSISLILFCFFSPLQINVLLHCLEREREKKEAFSWHEFQNKPYLLSMFPTELLWTLTFNMLTEFCRVWNVALGYFAISLSIACSDLDVIVLGHPLQGKSEIYLECFRLLKIKNSRGS